MTAVVAAATILRSRSSDCSATDPSVLSLINGPEIGTDLGVLWTWCL
jgi:hypothetical protein